MAFSIKGAIQDQRVKFLLIGGINTGVGYLLFVSAQLTVGHMIGYIGSLIFAQIVASIIAFTLYRTLVFKVKGNLLVDFGRFQTVYIVPFVINLVLLPTMVELLHWNPYLAQALMVAVSTTASYMGHKYFSFRRSATVSAANEPQNSSTTGSGDEHE